MVTPLFDAVWSDEACTTILTLTEDVDLDTPDKLRDAAAQARAFAERLMVLADERETAARRLDQQLAALATGQPQLVALFAEVVRDTVGTARNPWAALDRIIELMQGDRTTLDHQLAAVADTRAMAATESDPQRRADRIALADHAQAVAVAGTAVHAVTTQMGAAL